MRRLNFALAALLFAACSTRAPAPPPAARGDHHKDYDVEHYAIRIYVDAAGRAIHGDTSVRVRFPRGGSEVILDAREMEVRSVTGVATYAHAGGKLRLRFPPAGPAEARTFEISYVARPRRGVHFEGPTEGEPERPVNVWSQGQPEFNAEWFPCWDYPNDRATTEMVVLVPDGWTVIGNGRGEGPRPAAPQDWSGLPDAPPAEVGAVAAWRFVMDDPYPSYLVSFVAGPMDRVESQWRGRPLGYNAPRGMASIADLQRTFEKTPQILDFLGDLAGVAYPYPKLDQTTVIDFLWGGMENLSAVTLRHGQTVFADPMWGDWSSEDLRVHEIAHQWFGDYLTCRSWDHLWLNEGFATYCEKLWIESTKGREEFQYATWTGNGSYLGEAEDYTRPIVTHRYRDPDEMFDAHTYDKGAAVLHLLRYVLGSETFARALREYVRRNAWGLVETGDFRVACEAVAGRSLRWFFEEWVEQPGHPKYEVQSSWDDAARALTLTVNQSGRIFRTPLEVALHMRDGVERRSFEPRLARTVVRWVLPAKPRAVEFDPGGWILKELTFEMPPEERAVLAREAPGVWTRVWAAQGLDDAALDAAYGAERFWGVRVELVNAADGAELPTRALADENVAVREAAVRRLGGLAPEAMWEVMVSKATSDRSLRVRAAALDAMGRFGPRAVPWLRDYLRLTTRHREEMRGAIFGLGHTGDAAAAEVLRGYLAATHGSWIRTAAVVAIGELGGAGAAVEADLLPLLRDPSYYIRRDAIDGLTGAGTAAAIPALEESARTEAEFALRSAAEKAIGEIRARR